MPVGFQKSTTYAEQRLYAVRPCSLIRPPRIGRRLIRSWLRSATGVARPWWVKFVGSSTVVVPNVVREHHTQAPLTEDQACGR